MADLKPVDYDPFAGVKVTPVEGDPFAGVTATEVDHDPFADDPAARPPEPDSWKTIGQKIIENAPENLSQGVYGVGQYLEEHPTGPANLLLPGPAGEGLSKLTQMAADKIGSLFGSKTSDQRAQQYQDLYAQAAADVAENAPNVDPDSAKSYAYDAAQSIIQMAPGIAASVATRQPVIGAASIGAQVGGQKYAQSRQEGRTPGQAQMDALVYGAAEGIPEMLPLGVLMKPGQRFLRRTLTTAGAEGLSEMLTQIVQDGYDAGVVGEDMTWGQAWDNMKRAGILGTLTGGAISTATHPVQSFLERRAAAAETPPASAPGASGDAGKPAGDAAGAAGPRPGTPPADLPSAGAAAPAATIPETTISVGDRVGLRREGGAPQPVVVEGVQDGYVFFRDANGDQDAAELGDFRRDLTTAPPPAYPNTVDATTVPSPPTGEEAPPAINEFDPDLEQRPGKKATEPVAPQPQQAMNLPETGAIQAMRDAANLWMKTAAEAQRILDSGSPNARTPEDIAAMLRNAQSLMETASEQERNLTPKRTSTDSTAATPEQMAARKLGPLGGAAPAQSEAVTGPQQFAVTPKAAPVQPQAELAPVPDSEAEKPQPIAAPKPEPTWQEKLTAHIGQRESISDLPALAKRIGATEPELRAELTRMASGRKAPIRIVQGSQKVDPKTGTILTSRYAGKFQYAPRPTGKATQSLADLVYDSGGMAAGSFASELEARDLHTAKRPFKGTLIKPVARMGVQEMADHAMQLGWQIKPDATGQHADVDDFLTKLEQDHAGGRKHYAIGEEPVEAPERLATPQERKASALARFQELGLKPRGSTIADLEAELDAIENVIGTATPEEEPEFHFAIEQDAVDRLSPEAQAEAKQETSDDYPDEWYRQEISEGPAAAQSEAPSGVPEGGEQAGAEAIGEGGIAEPDTGSAEAAPDAGGAREPGLRAAGASGTRGQIDTLTDDFQVGADMHETNQRAFEWVRDRGASTGHEYGVFVGEDNKIIWAGTQNTHNAINFTDKVRNYLLSSGTRTTMHHNHPSGGPLSTPDMEALLYPRIGWVIAYGPNGQISAARISDAFRKAFAKLKPAEFDATFRSLVNNAFATSFKDHQTTWRRNPTLLNKDGSQGQDAAWRALHEAGIIDYISGMPVADVSYPFIENIQRQITQRLKDHGYAIDTTDRIHRPARATSVAGGLAEISGGPAKSQAQEPVYKPATDRGTQGSLFEETGTFAGAEDGAVPEDTQGTGTVLERLIGDESGALTAPDWARIKAAISKLRSGDKSAPKVAASAAALGPEGSLRRLSTIGRFIQNAAWLASQDQRSATYYNAMLKQDATKNRLQNAAFEKVKPYASLNEKDRATVNAMLEYYRLYGKTPEKHGRSLVVKVPDRIPPFGTARLTLSKPGQILAADKKMTAAIHSLMDMFGQTWSDLHEAMAREGGYTGEFTETGIKAAIAAAEHPRQKRAAQLAQRIFQNMRETAREGYAVPLQRYGDTFVAVTPKAPDEATGQSRPVHYEFIDTKSMFRDPFVSTRSGGSHQTVAQRVADLRKQYPADKFDIATGNVEPKAIQNLNLPEIEKALAMMNVATDKKHADAIDQLLHKLYEERKAGPRQQAIQTAGYSQDFERAITDYVMQMSSVISKMAHRDDVNSAFDATQQHGDENIRHYWDSYRNYQEKEGGDFNALRKIGFYLMMWGSPASAALDLTQTPLITQFQLAAWAGPRAAALAHGAMLEAMRAVRPATGIGLHVDLSKVGKTDAERALIQSAAADGRLGPQLSKEFQGSDISRRFPKHRPHLKRINVLWNWGASMKNAAEEVNRVAALLAAFRAAQNPQLRAKAAKVYADDQLFQQQVGRTLDPAEIAKFFVDDTQFVAGKINRSPAMRGFGGILLQFKNYPLNYLRLMHKNMTRMGKEGAMVGGMMMVGLALASGLLGIPFADDALKLAEDVTKGITGVDPMWEYRFRKWISGGEDEGFRQYAAEVITHGLSRNLFGADMSSRIGMGQLFPGDSLVNAVPLASAIYGRGAEAVERGSRGQPLGALAALSNFIGGKAGYDWVRAFAQSEEGVKTQYGGTVVKPSDVTLGQVTLRALGMQPTSVTRKQEQAYTEKRIAAATSEKKNRETTRLAQMMVDIMDARAAGNDEEVAELTAEFSEAIAEASAAFADKDTPMWQKMTPIQKTAFRRRIISMIAPEIARLKAAPKSTRQEILENQSQ